ncbi:MAG TPA: tetratricopeptide repeat protein [Planctomycetota bacterium]|nr:tetratricopeptide repeat protein [Planctomycetota bacterium]
MNPALHLARAASRCTVVLATLLVGFVVVPLRPAAAQAGDRIQFEDGHELRGQVSAQRLDGLVVSLSNGASTRFSWEKVARIEYDAPPRFTEAVAYAAAGLIDEALAEFDLLRFDNSLRAPIRQESLYRFAELSLLRGRCPDAIEAFQALVDGFPQGRYLVEAARGLAHCHLANGEPDRAARALDGIAGPAREDSRLGSEVEFLRARISEAWKDFAEARAGYERARRNEDLDPGRRDEAALGGARCLHAEGRTREAEQIYRELVDRDASPLVLAGAWNGLADLALAEGRAKRDPDRLTDALFAYMRGVVLYLPRADEPAEEQRRAVTGAAQCFEYLSQLASDPQVKAHYRLRARMLREGLADR